MKVVFAILCILLAACTSQQAKSPPPFVFVPIGVRYVSSPEEEARSVYQPGFHPRPEYPQQAKQKGQQGRVVIRAWVDEAGIVKDAKVEVSSGFPLLDAAAARSVRSARFKVRFENGVPASFDTTVPIGFQLDF